MNKVTFQTLKSVHTPDYPKEQWWNTFDNPTPELPEGFDYNPRNWKTVEDKIVETTEEEKALWDKEHPVPEPLPSIEEQLQEIKAELAIVKSNIETLKIDKEVMK
jgi:hypothetical protein